jgi:tetratricopeptide (TPR) repeat protein
VSARAPRFTDPLTRWLRRHPVEGGIVAASLIVTLVIGSFLWTALRLYESSMTATQSKEQERAEAVKERDAIHDAHAVTNARQRVADLRQEWAAAAGDEDQRRETEQQMADLLAIDALEDMPEIRAGALELAAEWARLRGVPTSEVLAALEPHFRGFDPDDALRYRAAVLTGLEEYEQARVDQRQRVARRPHEASPWIDLARLERLLGVRALEALALPDAEQHLRLATNYLRKAVDVARVRGDAELAINALVERARCWLELRQPRAAMVDLELALAHDRTRIDAESLVRTARRQLESRRGWGDLLEGREPSAPRPVEASAAPAGAAPAEGGLKPLFRAFERLLQSGGGALRKASPAAPSSGGGG